MRTSLVKTSLIKYVLLAGLTTLLSFHFSPHATLGDEGDPCVEPEDCTTSDAPICVAGSCTHCGTLLDQTDCEEETTGASTFCLWVTGTCVPLAAANEFPKHLKWIFPLGALLVALGALYRKKINRR